MLKLNGVHHIAIMTADMKTQVEFYSDVLGAKLVAMYWMHNVDGYFHAFMHLNDTCSVAFVQCPGIEDIKPQYGISHAGNVLNSAAAGVVQHIAFNVDTEEELLAMRDRIRSRKVRVLGPLDHGFCKSIYFGGPDNTVLEISTSEGEAINAQAWIDPEVVELCGISDQELAQYKNPAEYLNAGDPVPQPSAEECRFQYINMDEGLTGAFEMPDDAVTAELSENTPPVQVEAA
ncbi:MAG: VOC family protein [Gammaproteobacteria bacterium]